MSDIIVWWRAGDGHGRYQASESNRFISPGLRVLCRASGHGPPGRAADDGAGRRHCTLPDNARDEGVRRRCTPGRRGVKMTHEQNNRVVGGAAKNANNATHSPAAAAAARS